MKAVFIALAIASLLVAGCSLTDTETAPTGASGMRLLVGTNGMSTTLSHPDYDDWSPCMVNWQGTNYLYFLSTRPFIGPGYTNYSWNTITKSAGSTGIFRAEQVSAGTFSNIQLFYIFPNTIDSVVNQIVYTNSYSLPVVTATIVNSSFSELVDVYADAGLAMQNMSSFSSGSTPLFMGGIGKNDFGNTIVFFGEEITDERTLGFSTYSFIQTTIRSADMGGEINPERNRIKIIYPALPEPGLLLDAILASYPEIDRVRYKNGIQFGGASPSWFPNPLQPDQKLFGFYTSINGVLSVIIHNATTFTQYQSDNPELFDTILTNPDLLYRKLYLPLLTVTHYPGTVDKNPSYYPGVAGNEEGKGLYFASDREGRGRFNLYYVPDQYLRIPESMLADLPQLP